MRENRPHESNGPVLSRGQALVRRNLLPEGTLVKGPWWAVPGVVAIIGTLAIVSAAQGSLTSAKVTLPGSVQVAGAGAATRAASLPPSSTITGDEKVVAASRSVVIETESSTSRPGMQSESGSGSDSSTSNPVPKSGGGSGVTSSPESGADPTSPSSGSSDSSSDRPSTTEPITTTPTTTTTTSTTEPSKPDGQ